MPILSPGLSCSALQAPWTGARPGILEAEKATVGNGALQPGLTALPGPFGGQESPLSGRAGHPTMAFFAAPPGCRTSNSGVFRRPDGALVVLLRLLYLNSSSSRRRRFLWTSGFSPALASTCVALKYVGAGRFPAAGEMNNLGGPSFGVDNLLLMPVFPPGLSTDRAGAGVPPQGAGGGWRDDGPGGGVRNAARSAAARSSARGWAS